MNGIEKFIGVRNSAVASQPCPSGHITADKREIKDFPKPSPFWVGKFERF